jgi:hypothetical protein
MQQYIMPYGMINEIFRSIYKLQDDKNRRAYPDIQE